MLPLSVLLTVYCALLGLIVGSYLNVVIYRLPRELSTVLPTSACPSCEAKIRPLDNIPVLSFLLLRGRCRQCRSPISWRYPVVETATALLFIACYQRFGLSWEALAAVVYCCLLVLLAMIDLEHFFLPDRFTYPGIFIGLAISPWMNWTTPIDSVIGAAGGAGVLLAMAGAWYLIRREPGMGLGDVKMLAMIGAFLGWQGVLVSLFVSSLLGALTGLSLIAFGRMEMKSKLPFGFFLTLGGLLALFVGEAMVTFYRGYWY